MTDISTAVALINATVDSDAPIVNAYIHHIQQMFPYETNLYYLIPTGINSIALSYIFDPYDCEIIWRINNEHGILTKILNAKCGDQFISNILTIGELKWQITMKPNGKNRKTRGSCSIFLKLISMPSTYKHITVIRMIRCIQTHSSYIRMTRYINGTSKGWHPGVQSLNELNQHQFNEIQFMVKIQVIQIEMVKDNSSISIYPFKLSLKKHEEITWRVNEEVLECLKMANIGKQTCSDIYNGLWAIHIYPNGDDKDPGQCWVGLSLAALPQNIHKVKIKWKMTIMETETTRTSTADFYIRHSDLSLRMMPFEQLKQLNELTITIKIDIISIYDVDGKEMNHESIFEEKMNVEEDGNDQVFNKLIKSEIGSTEEIIAAVANKVMELTSKPKSVKFAYVCVP